MNENPLALLCGLFCIYPLLLFGLPGFVIGRVWGRAKFRSPFVMEKELPSLQRKATQQPKNDPIGFGSNR